jgi:hypothetical protein
MGTRADVEIITRDKSHRFSIYRDAIPGEVVSDLSDDEMDLEDVKRRLSLREDYESCPNYYYSISLVDRTIEIFYPDSSSTPWKRGQLIFSGTFAEAKQSPNL